MLFGRTWVCVIRPPSHPSRDRPGQPLCAPIGCRSCWLVGHHQGALLHELAHAMTSYADGRSDGHGPLFTGIYIQLLVRYLRLDRRMLINSLRDANIEILCDARPVFVDP